MSFKFNGRGQLQLTGKQTMSNSAFGYSAIGNTAPITISGASSGSNTINLGSIGGFTAQQVASIDPLVFKWQESNVTRYEIIEAKQDILALSVAWSRYRTNSTKGKITFSVDSMLDDRLFEYVNDEDIAHANKIRAYYDQKFTVLALKNVELSPFRKELKSIIKTDGTKFKESIIPIAYRMPEFYEYDLEFEELLFGYNREVVNAEVLEKSTKQLSLVKTFTVNSKRSKRKEYWFKDEHNNLVTYFVERSNPLSGLADKFFENDVRIEAVFKKRERDGYEFLKMHSINFG